MTRLIPRKVFVSAPRKLEVVFFTSSLAKFFQAQLIFEGVGLHLAYRAHEAEPYEEVYGGTKKDLLIAAVKEVRNREGTAGTLFFIEDTSIRIEALSDPNDNPGLRAKEWFTETEFEDLDRILSEREDRRAVVSSSIALAIPGRDEPIIFDGETEGIVADAPARFDPDPILPWLSPDNFSAWFIPTGANRTLSEMSYEESLRYDFRVRALMSMIDRLEEFAHVLNAPTSISSRSDAAFRTSGVYIQDQLFGRVTLIVGPPCSGKSTMGMWAQESENISCQVIDASSIVWARREDDGAEEMEISEFARRLLRDEGPDVVARIIADTYSSAPREPTLVVTGLRAIEEIQYFREYFTNVQVVSVEAPSRVRYQRYVKRATRRVIESYDEFRKHDAEQYAFGLLRVAPLLANIRVRNVGSRETYYRQAERVFGPNSTDAPGIIEVSSGINPERSQLYRCLVVLRAARRSLTTQEIEEDFDSDRYVRYNNANKMLKRYPELVRRDESVGSNVRYEITHSGRAFLAAVDWLRQGTRRK